MRQTYFTIALIILCTKIIISNIPGSSKVAIPDIQPELTTEGKVSTRSLTISNITPYELMMFKGISDTLAFRIYAQRNLIDELATTLPPDVKHTALQMIKGIGVKNSRKLSFLTKNRAEQ